MSDNIEMGIEMIGAENRLEVDILDDKLNISLAGDVDFTSFVKKLTLLIPEEKPISLTIPASEDPKIKLVLDTINAIVDSFNESLKQETVEDVANQ